MFVTTLRTRGRGYASAMTARFSLVAIDCPDPVALARYYCALTGLELAPL